MSEEDILAYVKAAAAAMDLPLDAASAQRVAQHLGRTSAMARMLEDAELAPHDELAQIYQPAPFPVDPA